jgi:hypothetical protein
MKPGTIVKVIMLRQRGDVPLDQGCPRKVHSAGLMPGHWRIVEMIEDGAIIEPAN